MIRTLLITCSLLWAAAALAADPAPTPPAASPAAGPSATLTADQITALGKIVPSGGFAHFGGFGTDSCPMPAVYASGFKPWKLNIVARTALEYAGSAPSDAVPNPGPPIDAVAATFRTVLEKCGFPVPADAGATPMKGRRSQPRVAEPGQLAGLPGPATLAYLSGLGANYHNLPTLFAMRQEDKAMLVVVGKDHPMKTFALPEGWGEAMTAYKALLTARGYR